MRSVVAIGLEALFLALAFGLRSWVQWRRTGSTGFVLLRRDSPVVERIGVGAGAVAMVLAFVAPMADLAGMARWQPLDSAALAVIGAAFAIAGIVLCLVAQFGMGDSWRIGVDHPTQTELVTGGVFAFVRNPTFTAMVTATIGLALLVPKPLAVLAVVLLVVGLELQVRFVEEPYLRRIHGDAYGLYAGSAGRFLPLVGTLRMSR